MAQVRILVQTDGDEYWGQKIEDGLDVRGGLKTLADVVAQAQNGELEDLSALELEGEEVVYYIMPHKVVSLTLVPVSE